MNEKQKSWRQQYKAMVDVEQAIKNTKFVSFSFNRPEDGLGGYFIGFDGRKTKYEGLTDEEKEAWKNQCEYITNFEEYINSLRYKGEEL